jgi:ribosomal 30S subunit maturation factor RimM
MTCEFLILYDNSEYVMVRVYIFTNMPVGMLCISAYTFRVKNSVAFQLRIHTPRVNMNQLCATLEDVKTAHAANTSSDVELFIMFL